MKKIYILISSLLLALASCSTGTQTDTKNIEGTFVLHSFGGTEIPIPADKRFPTLKFDNAHKKLTGFTGCNTINGSYETSSSKLQVGPLAITKKACFNDEFEPKILKALDEANIYEVKDNLLILKRDNQTLIVLRKLNLLSYLHRI